MQHAVADRCMAMCQQASVADEDAGVIAEALAGYLYGWCGRDADLDARVDHAQAALNLAAGGVAGWWRGSLSWISRQGDRRHAVRQSCRHGRALMGAARQKETSHG